MGHILDFLRSIDWGSVITILITLGIIIFSVLKFFSKPFIESLGKKTAELLTISQKTEIEEAVKSGYNQALEILKSNLKREDIEFQIRLTTFYSKRTEILIKLFNLMTNYYSIAHEMVDTDNNGGVNQIKIHFFEKKEKYLISLSKLNNFLAINRLFLSKELRGDIFSFYEKIKKYIDDFEGVLNSYEVDELRIFEKNNIQTINECYEFDNNCMRINKLRNISSDIRIVLYQDLNKFSDTFISLIHPTINNENTN